MDDFDFHTFKFGKSTKNRRFHVLQSLVTLFRYLELFAAIALFTWLLSRAPLAIKAFCDYFRQISAAAASPVFGFLLGNAIIGAIVVKSYYFTHYSKEDNAESEICEKSSSDAPKDSKEKKMVFQDKEIACDDVPELNPPEEESRVSDPEPRELRMYRRSQSDKIEPVPVRNRTLRRSETALVAEVRKLEYPEDSMSNEEFRLKVDEFIARHERFFREESNSALAQT